MNFTYNTKDRFLRFEKILNEDFFYWRMHTQRKGAVEKHTAYNILNNQKKYKETREQFYGEIGVSQFFENNFLRFTFLSAFERFVNLRSSLLHKPLDFKDVKVSVYKQGFFNGIFRGQLLNFAHLFGVHSLANNTCNNTRAGYFLNAIFFEAMLYPLEYFKTLRVATFERLNTLQTIKQVNYQGFVNGFVPRMLFACTFTSGVIVGNTDTNFKYFDSLFFALSCPLLAIKNLMQTNNLSWNQNVELVMKGCKLQLLKVFAPFFVLNTLFPLKIEKLRPECEKKKMLKAIDDDNYVKKYSVQEFERRI